MAKQRKRIGIVTILDNNNYGNRLQNYAVQEVLNAMGCTACTIRNKPVYNTDTNFFAIVAWNVLNTCKGVLLPKRKKANRARQRNFSQFNKRIQFNRELYFGCFRYDTCDYYITGSDQVWNPFFGRLTQVDTLAFAKPEKRIAFSASFGVEQVPEDSKPIIAKEISEFKAISVREDAGKRIVEEITGRSDVQVLPDPTMLLPADEWGRLARKPQMLKTENFILTCFLGEVPEERVQEIFALAEKWDCNIINIQDRNSQFYECGPSEFLYLEKHAKLICTDSFHSSVFAILFDRPFVVYDRPMQIGIAMNSRIDTLLTKFHLMDRRYTGQTLTEDCLIHDYTQAYEILKEERRKANTFLQSALSIG